MRLKVIQTSDGPKLHGGKNLVGSLPTKSRVPKAGIFSKVKKNDDSKEKEGLNTKLFHGTHFPFTPGEVIEPQGNNTREAVSSGEYTYATTDIKLAKIYACDAVSEFGDDAIPHVFEVESQGKIEIDPNSIKSVRIKGTLLIIREVKI